MKAALVYKIANYVEWPKDTSTFFQIGILSNNKYLKEKFQELANSAKIKGKKIKLTTYTSYKSLNQAHLIFIGESYNYLYQDIIKKIANWNTLLVSEEHTFPGEIMINLKLDKKNQLLTFEYNRANILFQGLELDEKIILLKGTEIEIRELYLQAKKLWDEQKAELESLKVQSNIQSKNLKIQKDSVEKMRKTIEENNRKINDQVNIIIKKDTLSNRLNLTIQNQQKEIQANRYQIENFIDERSIQESLINNYKYTIKNQEKLSDSLTNEIVIKKEDLEKRKKALGEKEILIKRQTNWLIISLLIIFIILASISLTFRAYLINKRAKQKIAEQKNELETTLEKLKETQQQLIHSEKMASLGILSSGIAHEINNPLNFINGGISAIKSYFQEDLKEHLPKVAPLIDAITEGVSRASNIVSSLSHYSRKEDLPRTLCNINDIINNCLVIMQNQLKNKIEVRKFLTKKEYELIGNEGQLHQAILNIISNSEHAIEKNGVLNITTEVLIGELQVTISDDGCGIKKENIEKIFDPFFTTKEPGKGTGLGLSITYKIIQEHNGSLDYSSIEGEGTTVILKLPIKK